MKMREEEIKESYESLKKTADKALAEAKDRGRTRDIIEEMVGFVVTVVVAFVWLMLMLLLISFVGLSYVHFQLYDMVIWSAIFAIAVGVISAVGIIKKHGKKE